MGGGWAGPANDGGGSSGKEGWQVGTWHGGKGVGRGGVGQGEEKLCVCEGGQNDRGGGGDDAGASLRKSLWPAAARRIEKTKVVAFFAVTP